jgi:hypothetical protein
MEKRNRCDVRRRSVGFREILEMGDVGVFTEWLWLEFWLDCDQANLFES